MRNVLRLAVIATLVLGAGGVRADDDVRADNASVPQMESSSTATSDAGSGDGSGTTAKRGPAPGAASMEPGQGIDEDPGTGAHQQWVESIWTSP
jgi:hypothetical protein